MSTGDRGVRDKGGRGPGRPSGASDDRDPIRTGRRQVWGETHQWSEGYLCSWCKSVYWRVDGGVPGVWVGTAGRRGSTTQDA